MRKTTLFTIAQLALALGIVLAGAPSASAQDDVRYRLRPTDVLELQYRYSPEYSQTVSIGPDGYVSLQLIGPISIGGLTVEEAQARILTVARTRLRDPEVTLILREYERPFVTVAGYVTTPGKVELKGPMTIVEALALSGGFRPDGKQSQVILFRRATADEYETQLFDVKKLMSPDGRQQDVMLQANDLLVVPQNRVSKVDRMVKALNLGFYLNPLQLLIP
jgi:polysaccharide export outer membrane protein